MPRLRSLAEAEELALSGGGGGGESQDSQQVLAAYQKDYGISEVRHPLFTPHCIPSDASKQYPSYQD